MVPKVLRLVSRAQVRIFRATGGRVGSRWRIGAGWRQPVPTLLLTHCGRKSGKEFTVPLLYLEQAGTYVVVGSQGGLPQHPQWYLNLVANPQASIQIGAVVTPVTARVAQGPERDGLWQQLVQLYADFGDYQSWTQRQIPVVVLTPC